MFRFLKIFPDYGRYFLFPPGLDPPLTITYMMLFSSWVTNKRPIGSPEITYGRALFKANDNAIDCVVWLNILSNITWLLLSITRYVFPSLEYFNVRNFRGKKFSRISPFANFFTFRGNLFLRIELFEKFRGN